MGGLQATQGQLNARSGIAGKEFLGTIRQVQVSRADDNFVLCRPGSRNQQYGGD